MEQELVEQPDSHDVIYAIRTAHQNQTQLNMMADQKANVLVGAIVVLLSLFISRIPQADTYNINLVIAISVFVGFEIIALLLSIMVIRPRTRWSGKPQQPEQLPNPLFFGFFTSCEEQQYVDYMLGRLQDNHSARELLLRDFYQIGKILKRKFALLRYAYFFAVSGILIASASYLLVLAV